MEYWIDGYNLLFMLSQEENNFQALREKLLEMLHKHFSHLNLTIIFDATYQEDEFLHVTNFHNFSIIFTPAKMTADDFIIERLSFEDHPKNITVVTSDKGLLKHALYQGAKTQTLQSFLKPKKASTKQLEEKCLKESDDEIERLLKIFEKRLKGD